VASNGALLGAAVGRGGGGGGEPIEGWGGSRAGLDTLEQINMFCHCQESIPDSSVIRPIAQSLHLPLLYAPKHVTRTLVASDGNSANLYGHRTRTIYEKNRKIQILINRFTLHDNSIYTSRVRIISAFTECEM
jgi:hypothetical protein